MEAERGGKIIFANQLRGLAVLSVMVAHYLGVYWGSRDVVAQYIGAPIVTERAPHIFAYVFFSSTFNYGPFGVAVFFLISGFVIPFSLEKLGSTRFIIARSFRIFPTYWAASAFTLGVVYLSTKYWGSEYYVTAAQAIVNMFLLEDEFGLHTIDMVNWSLCIEILFYASAILMLPFIRRASALALVNFSLAVMALVTWWPESWDAPIMFDSSIGFIFRPLKHQLMMVCFLYIGTLFNFRLRGRISAATLFGATLSIFVIVCATWPKTSIADQFPGVPINYFCALVLFSVCFALRDRFKPRKIIDFMADISYPLYLVHAISGYAIIRLLMADGFRYYQAALVAFSCAVTVAYILHKVIETPTSNIFKRARPAQDDPQAPVPTHQ